VRPVVVIGMVKAVTAAGDDDDDDDERNVAQHCHAATTKVADQVGYRVHRMTLDSGCALFCSSKKIH
jgi:hypothetical protein